MFPTFKNETSTKREGRYILLLLNFLGVPERSACALRAYADLLTLRLHAAQGNPRPHVALVVPTTSVAGPCGRASPDKFGRSDPFTRYDDDDHQSDRIRPVSPNQRLWSPRHHHRHHHHRNLGLGSRSWIPTRLRPRSHHDDAGAAERMDGVAAFSDVPPPPPPEQEGHHHVVDAGDGGMPMIAANSNQLTLLFQGEVYVFESVTPEKVPPLPLNFFY